MRVVLNLVPVGEKQIWASACGLKPREWASWAAALYRRSILDSTHYASQPDFRDLFAQSIHEFESFAESGVIP
jgi:hypothetical protein